MTDPALVKAAAAGVEAVSEPAKTFLGKVAGRAGDEAGEVIADRVQVRRWKRQVVLLEKATKFAEKKGIDPKEIPLRTLFPLLASGSEEEDDDMVDRWAALLATAAGEPGDVPPSFPAILKELAPVEARMLDDIHSITTAGADDAATFQNQGAVGQALAKRHGLSADEFEVHADNLLRLRLVLPPRTRFEFTDTPASQFLQESKATLTITHLGRAFVLACRP